jgi:hypothetical protein
MGEMYIQYHLIWGKKSYVPQFYKDLQAKHLVQSAASLKNPEKTT